MNDRVANDQDPGLDHLLADVFNRQCHSREILDHVASRWAVLALVALREKEFRFNALRRRINGVSEKMLAQTLQMLERDGFVHREEQRTIPPRVEYSLTPMGCDVADDLVALVKRLEGLVGDVQSAQARYDVVKVAGIAAGAPGLNE